MKPKLYVTGRVIGQQSDVSFIMTDRRVGFEGNFVYEGFDTQRIYHKNMRFYDNERRTVEGHLYRFETGKDVLQFIENHRNKVKILLLKISEKHVIELCPDYEATENLKNEFQEIDKTFCTFVVDERIEGIYVVAFDAIAAEYFYCNASSRQSIDRLKKHLMCYRFAPKKHRITIYIVKAFGIKNAPLFSLLDQDYTLKITTIDLVIEIWKKECLRRFLNGNRLYSCWAVDKNGVQKRGSLIPHSRSK